MLLPTPAPGQRLRGGTCSVSRGLGPSLRALALCRDRSRSQGQLCPLARQSGAGPGHAVTPARPAGEGAEVPGTFCALRWAAAWFPSGLRELWPALHREQGCSPAHLPGTHPPGHQEPRPGGGRRGTQSAVQEAAGGEGERGQGWGRGRSGGGQSHLGHEPGSSVSSQWNQPVRVGDAGREAGTKAQRGEPEPAHSPGSLHRSCDLCWGEGAGRG